MYSATRPDSSASVPGSKVPISNGIPARSACRRVKLWLISSENMPLGVVASGQMIKSGLGDCRAVARSIRRSRRVRMEASCSSANFSNCGMFGCRQTARIVVKPPAGFSRTTRTP